LPFARRLARGRRVIAVGRLAESALDSPYVRHPAHGGATAFAHMLALATLATPSVQMVDRQFNVAADGGRDTSPLSPPVWKLRWGQD